MEQQAKLAREINLYGLTSNIINTIIGAGIFIIPAIVAEGLGSASIFAYIFCSILSMLMMLNAAEVGSKITDSGGVYAYIEKSFGRYPGFLTAILMLLATISADAAIANAVIKIIFKLFPYLESEAFKIGFFFLLFAGLGYVNVRGLRKGVGVVIAITLLKIIPLLLIILLGFKEVDLINLHWEEVPSLEKIGAASLILFFAYTGAGSALSVSGEVINPQKTIPKAILISIVIVSIIYILVQTVAQGVLGESLPQFKENPLGEVASKIFGPLGFTLLTIGAGVSMFGSISSKILSVPRILYAAADDKILPFKSLAYVHKRFATPYVSIIVYSFLCFLFASVGGFKYLAVISSASSILISLGISIATIKLRRDPKYANMKGAFRIPGGYTVPILAACAILWLLSSLSPQEFYSITGFTALLTLIYVLIERKNILSRFKKKT